MQTTNNQEPLNPWQIALVLLCGLLVLKVLFSIFNQIMNMI